MDGFSYQQSDNYLTKPIAKHVGVNPKLLSPVTMMLPLKIHGKPSTRLLRVHLNSGGSSTIINRHFTQGVCSNDMWNF